MSWHNPDRYNFVCLVRSIHIRTWIYIILCDTARISFGCDFRLYLTATANNLKMRVMEQVEKYKFLHLLQLQLRSVQQKINKINRMELSHFKMMVFYRCLIQSLNQIEMVLLWELGSLIDHIVGLANQPIILM